MGGVKASLPPCKSSSFTLFHMLRSLSLSYKHTHIHKSTGGPRFTKKKREITELLFKEGTVGAKGYCNEKSQKVSKLKVDHLSGQQGKKQ